MKIIPGDYHGDEFESKACRQTCPECHGTGHADWDFYMNLYGWVPLCSYCYGEGEIEIEEDYDV